MAKAVWRNSASIILVARIASKSKIISSNVKLSRKIQNSEYNYKVLFLKRGDDSKFFPNSYVYPGGVLDPADLSLEWLTLFKDVDLNQPFKTKGPFPLIFQDEKLQKVGSPHASEKTIPIHIASRICAIRETFEESGILLARKKIPESITKPVTVSEVFSFSDDSSQILKWKQQILKDANVFLKMCKEYNIYPDIWSLHEWSNWLTPTYFKKRFNTVFYTSFINLAPGPHIDGEEIIDAKWMSPSEVLSEFYQKNIFLPPPQNYETSRLAQLDNFEDLSKFSANRALEGLSCWLPIQLTTSDNMVHLMPGDDHYPKPDYLNEQLLSTNQTLEENHKGLKNINRLEGTKIKNYRVRCNMKMPNGHLSPACDDDFEKDVESKL